MNGSLFAGNTDCPRFSRTARAYLLRAGELDWKEINPDIFGSMIQAVAEDDERGALGMHYTSVPNILKVLDPLFLDDLRAQLDAAGDNLRKLKHLRRRIAAIRVFDPACGSGNFLVVAYNKMREIEHEVVKRLGEKFVTQIKLENFYGIEIRSFPVEIAKLSLLIAEFQCNVRLYGEDVAWLNVLPLHRTGQIYVDNALRRDWAEVCPPAVRMAEAPTDLFGMKPVQSEFDFDLKVLETYICGNPPYFGSKWQAEEQKLDLEAVFKGRQNAWKSLDYVAGWFLKGTDYCAQFGASCAFVSTNSICQGQQVPLLWPVVFQLEVEIFFAHTSFKWSNLASRNAVVTVVIIGLKKNPSNYRTIFETHKDDEQTARTVSFINAYLVPGANVIVEPSRKPRNNLPEMLFGNMPRDGGHLLLSAEERRQLLNEYPNARCFVKLFQGSEDFTSACFRSCLWITETEADLALRIPPIRKRLEAVASFRTNSNAGSTRQFAKKAYRFVQIQGVARERSIIVPRHTSEAREWLPVGINRSDVIIADSALAIYDAPLWALALIASRLHLVWIATVCGKIKTVYRYSNTIGWNTFPIPTLTENNKDELSRCAEGILLARERFFPLTVSELYSEAVMPRELRIAHQQNDDVCGQVLTSGVDLEMTPRD